MTPRVASGFERCALQLFHSLCCERTSVEWCGVSCGERQMGSHFLFFLRFCVFLSLYIVSCCLVVFWRAVIRVYNLPSCKWILAGKY